MILDKNIDTQLKKYCRYLIGEYVKINEMAEETELYTRILEFADNDTLPYYIMTQPFTIKIIDRIFQIKKFRFDILSYAITTRLIILKLHTFEEFIRNENLKELLKLI